MTDKTAAAAVPDSHADDADAARDAQAAIVEDFALFGDWTERYQYLIDLGRKLAPLPEDERSDLNRLHGCTSMVWIVIEGKPDAMTIRATSDSSIVAGLIAIAIAIYSGRSAATIAATEPAFVTQIGLGRHLSPSRNDGLAAFLRYIRATAQTVLDGNPIIPAGLATRPAPPG